MKKPKSTRQQAPKAKPATAPKTPPAQDGDEVEVSRPAATPATKHPSEKDARAELDENPTRTSVLSDKGHVVREG